MNFAFDLITLVFALVLTFVVLCGLGRVVRRWCGADRLSPMTSMDAWAGLVVLIVLLESLNYLLPIDWRITLGIGLIGVVCFARYPQAAFSSSRSVRDYATLYPKWSSFILLMLLLWCCKAFNFPDHPDSGLYHFQSIRLWNEYAIIPGLANLHTRLAFNQSWFGIVALLNASPFWQNGHGLGGMLLVLLVVLSVVEARFEKERFGGAFIAALFISIDKCFRTWLSSPAPDVAIMAFQIVILVFLLRTLLTQGRDPHVLTVLVLLCAAMVSVKFSGAMFVLAVFGVVWFSIGRKVWLAREQLAKPVLLCLLMGGVHAGRGYILSGLPIYPSAVGAAWGLEWAVTPEVAANEIRWILSWARHPGESPELVLNSWSWIHEWWRNLFRQEGSLIVGIVVLGIAVLGLMANRFHKASISLLESSLLRALVPLVFSTAFWFVTAPDWRFLGAIGWLLLSLEIWICLQSVPVVRRQSGKYIPRLAEGMLILCCVVMATNFARTVTLDGWAAIPTPNLIQRVTDSGLRVDIAQDDMCWASAPPCTPYFDSRLRLRRSTEKNAAQLQSGLVVKPP